MSRKPYLINLRDHLAECDANYHRLAKLLRGPEEQRQWHFGLSLSEQASASLKIELTQRAPYTSMLNVQFSSGVKHLNEHMLYVRMYHDTQTVEVTACKYGKPLAGHYEYPNQSMYQPDEKEQLNHMLGDWLRNCLQSGYVLDELAVVG